MKYIQLTQGKQTVVDDEDFERLSQWKWHYTFYGYAKKGSRKGALLMHRFIMSTPKGMDTDHINGDRLDNRRGNLRVVTRSQNMMNSIVARNSSSGSKGVYWQDNMRSWKAEIRVNGKRLMLGYFENKNEAIEARCIAEAKLHGEYARTR